MKAAENPTLTLAVVAILAMRCSEQPQSRSRSTTSTAEHAVIAAPPRNDLTAQEIDQLIDSFRFTASNHIVRPGGPPTGSTAAARTLLRNLDRAAPALLAALTSSNNDIRRNAAYTLGASRRREFAAPLERAIAAELTSRIHQPSRRQKYPKIVISRRFARWCSPRNEREGCKA